MELDCVFQNTDFCSLWMPHQWYHRVLCTLNQTYLIWWLAFAFPEEKLAPSTEKSEGLRTNTPTSMNGSGACGGFRMSWPTSGFLGYVYYRTSSGNVLWSEAALEPHAWNLGLVSQLPLHFPPGLCLLPSQQEGAREYQRASNSGRSRNWILWLCVGPPSQQFRATCACPSPLPFQTEEGNDWPPNGLQEYSIATTRLFSSL